MEQLDDNFKKFTSVRFDVEYDNEGVQRQLKIESPIFINKKYVLYISRHYGDGEGLFDIVLTNNETITVEGASMSDVINRLRK